LASEFYLLSEEKRMRGAELIIRAASGRSGAVVRGASVELSNSGTGFTRRVETDAEGRFLFDLVPPATYDLTASANGFAPYRQQGITLDVNVPSSRPIRAPSSTTPRLETSPLFQPPPCGAAISPDCRGRL
jgi:hypothetical protein